VAEPAEHWDRVYATKSTTGVSWFQREPAVSLRLIKSVAAGAPSSVIDIGGGASVLVDRLLDRGFTDLTVLDVSQHVLDEVRDRLGKRGASVMLVRHDVLTWAPDRKYDIWHDRAVLHFLTEPAERERYVQVAQRAVSEDGALIVGAFAEDGPTQCSGLPVARYSAKDLANVFSENFVLVTHEQEEHVTPAGVVQPFTWVVLRRARLLDSTTGAGDSHERGGTLRTQ
jgi:ubiquinone/menaquinone biosynthesis C-methylase UbiE